MKCARTLLLLCALVASASGAPPKCPPLLVGDQLIETLTWHNGMALSFGWWRVDATPIEGIVVQGFVKADRLLVDVFNVGEEPVRIGFVGVYGEEGEYDRVVPPSCGIGWSSSPSTVQVEDPPAGKWDHEYVKSWQKTDKGWTFTTGSGRSRFYSALDWRANHDVLSRQMEVFLDRWVRWQLHRSYQDPDPVRGLPRTFLGLSPAEATNRSVVYESLPDDTVSSYDTHHLTLAYLTDAWRLTRDPRALDQVIRLLSLALATEPLYGASETTPWGGPAYGGIERVPGWLLVALADGIETAQDARLLWLAEKWTLVAQSHLDLLETIGVNELGLPNVVAPADARHILVPHNLPWQGATVLFGLCRVSQVTKSPQARKLISKWRNYLETSGWDGQGVVYDAIPHFPKDSQVEPSKADTPGTGLWLAPALIASGRTEETSELLHFLCDVGRKTKYNGVVLFSPNGWVGYYGPLID